MKLMEGKKGIIFGVSNTRGIAYSIAKQIHEAGAEIAFTYANEAMEGRVRPLAEEMGSKLIVECDVTNEEQMNNTKKLTESWILLFMQWHLQIKKIFQANL